MMGGKDRQEIKEIPVLTPSTAGVPSALDLSVIRGMNYYKHYGYFEVF